MSLARKAIYVVGAKRTPFGAFGGKLKHLSATDLAVISSKAALAEANLSGDKIDDCFMGNVIQSAKDAAYLARHVALKSGAPIKSPALTLNRLCGSGFEAVCLGAESIELDRAEVALVGGTENMSQAPMVIDGLTSRWGAALGKGMKAEDSLWAGLTDSMIGLPMGITAENLADQYDLSREDCDAFALRSQQAWAAANEAGYYKPEIVPIELKTRKGMVAMTEDEHPRPSTTIADLNKLKPVFKPDGGRVTAGSASGICDGAASLVLASDASVSANNLAPISRVVAWSRVGCEPTHMGIGPVGAIEAIFKATNMSAADMDLIEINEAFAAQFLACEKALELDREKMNVCGGAIALGHPLGASGARITAHLAQSLKRTGKKYGLGAACIGGGQGIAVLLENVQ
mmetsp:Transcript_25874/g.48569  ORF Transcript_25874/g.48569 Transcript_25874/m.48569 type:complete len:402 (+) Transcript_25874:71-1276(+)